MVALLAKFRSQPGFGKKVVMTLVLGAIGATAFYLGRLAGPQHADAQQTGSSVIPGYSQPITGGIDTEYSRRVVATIYGNMPITREELGEFLIARFGAERLEFLVNRKIVEKACQVQGITVTEAQIDAQLQEDLKAYGGPTMTDKLFANQILRKFNKSLYEWREDVIRPKLMMTEYCKSMVHVTEDDIKKAYDARHGPKVQCRLIVLEKNNPKKNDIWKEVSQSEAKFIEHAKQQMITELAVKEGLAPPIHRHFGDEWIEKQAFNMMPGDVTIPKQLEDGTWLIMRCEKHLLADNTVTLTDVRMKLSQELAQVKLTQKVAETIKLLREQAAPQLHLTAQQRQNSLDQQLRQDVNPASGPVSTATSPQLKR